MDTRQVLSQRGELTHETQTISHSAALGNSWKQLWTPQAVRRLLQDPIMFDSKEPELARFISERGGVWSVLDYCNACQRLTEIQKQTLHAFLEFERRGQKPTTALMLDLLRVSRSTYFKRLDGMCKVLVAHLNAWAAAETPEEEVALDDAPDSQPLPSQRQPAEAIALARAREHNELSLAAAQLQAADGQFLRLSRLTDQTNAHLSLQILDADREANAMLCVELTISRQAVAARQREAARSKIIEVAAPLSSDWFVQRPVDALMVSVMVSLQGA